MSKVIILTDRNNPLKIEENKRLLFKSRLNMSSSHRKNLASLSIPNSQLNINKQYLVIKEKNKFTNKKEKVNPYTHRKNITYINGNNNHLKDRNNFNFKNFNSTFNNFSKNIKNDKINNNYKKVKQKENNKNYYSNKTFINKSLNNSVIGKSVLNGRKIKNFEKNKKRQKKDQLRAKKKIISLSNSLTKSNKNKNNDYYKYYKKEFINKNIKKNILTIREDQYNSIKSENIPNLPIKEHKYKKNNNKSKSISKYINNSFNIFGNKKFRKLEDNTKDSIGNITDRNKVKLKKVDLIINNSKEKKILDKYNNKNINKINNKKFYRNNLLLSSKEINKTEINSENNIDKQKIIKDKNKNLVKRNIYNNKLHEKKNHDFLEREEIKVNKIEEVFYLENSNINKIINSGSDNLQNEEEEEEDSNILSLDDVQDIIRYFDFSEIDKFDNNLFYRNDYKIFIENSKNLLLKEFFEESLSLKSIIKNKKSEKNINKKKSDNKNENNYYKNLGISSPIHNIISENKIYKTFKK